MIKKVIKVVKIKRKKLLQKRKIKKEVVVEEI